MLDPVPWQYRASWPADPSHVADARRFVDTHLREHGLSTQSDAVVVVVSELATNAVLYSATPFSVSLGRADHTLTLSVHDGSLDTPSLRPLHGPLGERGRGLHIVSQLSSDWGVVPDREGKSVWAEFQLPLEDRPPR
jgi:anti-sigma regulatory factor (Ser/Thr protein kinase)